MTNGKIHRSFILMTTSSAKKAWPHLTKFSGMLPILNFFNSSEFTFILCGSVSLTGN